jgi:hypothetical protein
MTERTFDWVPRHDPRSRNFPVRAALPVQAERRKKLWLASRTRLDQGYEGACSGFAWGAELLASPRPAQLGSDPNQFARYIYREAQKIDEWEGENYEGTSVLAGAKVVKRLGHIESYRWAFGIDDVIDALVTLGPVVIGIPWYEEMYETRPSGLVKMGGRIVGGHAITLTGYHPGIRLFKESWTTRFEVVKWRNSWGKEYGRNGDGYIRVSDLASLLADYGEACVPVNRLYVPQ